MSEPDPALADTDPRAYLNDLSAHADRSGDTSLLHPDMAARLAGAIRDARAAGLPVTLQSGYRDPHATNSSYDTQGLSLHDKGGAADIGGIGGPGSPQANIWASIATAHGLFNPYLGTKSEGAEYNHWQLIPDKLENNPTMLNAIKAAGNDRAAVWNAISPLREDITAPSVGKTQSPVDMVNAAFPVNLPPSHIAQLLASYQSGVMPTGDRAQFEKDVSNGQIVLPRGLMLGGDATKPKSGAAELPQSVADAYNQAANNPFNSGVMSTEDRKQLDKDLASGLVKVPSGTILNQTYPSMLDNAKEMVTGAGRATDATRALPELMESGGGGLFAGANVPLAKQALLAANILTQTDPAQIGKMLHSVSPDIGVVQDEKGNLIAENGKTGAKFVINRPGLSPMDIVQGAGLLAAFSPAGAARTVVGSVVANAATQGAIEAGHTLSGGDASAGNVLAAGAVGGAVPLAAKLIGAGARALRPGEAAPTATGEAAATVGAGGEPPLPNPAAATVDAATGGAATATQDIKAAAVNAGAAPITPEATAGALTAEETAARAKLAETMLGYHGSPKAGLTELNASGRGPLGPGVYVSPNTNIAKKYSGDTGTVYSVPIGDKKIFPGGSKADYAEFQTAKEALSAAVEPEYKGAIQPIIDKMQKGDGYPTFARIAQIYKSNEGAQNLFKRAGFEGVSADVDGPEILLFGNKAPILLTPEQAAARQTAEAEAVTRATASNDAATAARSAPPKTPTTAEVAAAEAPKATVAPASIDELVTASKAASRPGAEAAPAQKFLIEQAAPDAEKVAAAKRLGVLGDLQPDHVTTNAIFSDFMQGVKSQVGSPIKAEEQAGLQRVGQRATSLIEEMGGTKDIGQLSADVKARLTNIQSELDKRAEAAYNKLAANIPAKTEAPASTVIAMIQKRADDLGGVANLSPMEKTIYNKLRPKTVETPAAVAPTPPVGKITAAQYQAYIQAKAAAEAQPATQTVTQPTYALLDDVRKNIGDALRNRGPFKDTQIGLLKHLYSGLSQDQEIAAAQHGMSDTFNAARTAVQLRKGVENDLTRLFGKQLEGSITTKLATAISSVEKGDAANIVKLLKSVPENMRQQVVASGLAETFGKATQNGALNFNSFVKWYDGLKDNKIAMNAIMSNLPTEARQGLADLYEISKGINASVQKFSTTGKSLQITQKLNQADSVMQNVTNAVLTHGKKAAIVGPLEMASSAVGLHGLGTVLGLTLLKGEAKQATGAEAVTQLFQSPEFKAAMDAHLQGKPIQETARKLAYTRSFTKFVRSLNDRNLATNKERFALTLFQTEQNEKGN